MKTNKRLSCTFIDNNDSNHHQIQTIKPLKPCLRIPKTSDHHLDLPSINFEHFIESTKQQENLSNNNHRKRVCIVTDKPLTKNAYDQTDNLSDFIDEHNGLLKVQSPSNDFNFYKNLTNSPMEYQRPAPPGKSLDYDR
jgi:hypothetical protein